MKDLSVSTSSKFVKFRLISNFHLKESVFLRAATAAAAKQNAFFEFRMSVSDGERVDTALVQLAYVNRNQRVKLVFSKSMDKVMQFQDEFQVYVSNLTGHRAIIDKVNICNLSKNETLTFQSSSSSNNSTKQEQRNNQQFPMTEMILHFINSDQKQQQQGQIEALASRNALVVDADRILASLDRSWDTNLIKKYKLVLAEKYDEPNVHKFHKYGGLNSGFSYDSSDPDAAAQTLLGYLSSFLWPGGQQLFYVRVLFAMLCVALLACSALILIVCCCMRTSYKRKLRAERALVKAFGLEQRTLAAYNDTIHGYVNAAFDTANSLLPIPGTNLYAYEGSNPVWLKKYDKLENKRMPCSSSSSGGSSRNEKLCAASSSGRQHSKSEDISSFYLKEINSSGSSNSSSAATSPPNDRNNTAAAVMTVDKSLTSEVCSISEQDAALFAASFAHGRDSIERNRERAAAALSDGGGRQQQPVMSSFKAEAALLTFLKGSPPQQPVCTSEVKIWEATKSGPKEAAVSFRAQLKHISEMYLENNGRQPQQGNGGAEEGSGGVVINKYTKIFDTNSFGAEAEVSQNRRAAAAAAAATASNGLSQQTTSKITHFCDLFEVESTVI